jgi:hypothetical protein
MLEDEAMLSSSGDSSPTVKEANMRKLTTAVAVLAVAVLAVAVLALGLWLLPIGALAQGRGLGRADGGPAVSGAHAPLGAPGADADNGNGHESAHDATAGGPKDSGKKSPDELLAQNKNLSGNLNNLLTKMGLKNPDGSAVTAQEACANFRNLGQCVAAIHVANNLGINFNKLACDMTLKPVNSPCPTGTATTSKGMSLGASIDALKPGTDSKTEAHKAVTEANQDMKGSGS